MELKEILSNDKLRFILVSKGHRNNIISAATEATYEKVVAAIHACGQRIITANDFLYRREWSADKLACVEMTHEINTPHLYHFPKGVCSTINRARLTFITDVNLDVEDDKIIVSRSKFCASFIQVTL